MKELIIIYGIIFVVAGLIAFAIKTFKEDDENAHRDS